jgi:hypothetical protein
MLPAKQERMVREAVAVFDDVETMEAAIDELLRSGFDRAELSLVAGEDTVVKELGHMYAKVEQVEDDTTVPRAAFVSEQSIGEAEGALVSGLFYVGAVAAAGAVVASGGAVLAAIGGAVIAGGVGGYIGAAFASWLDEHHARYLQEQLDRGGLLLWVRIWNNDREKKAVRILNGHSAHDVHVHGVPDSGN